MPVKSRWKKIAPLWVNFNSINVVDLIRVALWHGHRMEHKVISKDNIYLCIQPSANEHKRKQRDFSFACGISGTCEFGISKVIQLKGLVENRCILQAMLYFMKLLHARSFLQIRYREFEMA